MVHSDSHCVSTSGCITAAPIITAAASQQSCLGGCLLGQQVQVCMLGSLQLLLQLGNSSTCICRCAGGMSTQRLRDMRGAKRLTYMRHPTQTFPAQLSSLLSITATLAQLRGVWCSNAAQWSMHGDISASCHEHVPCPWAHEPKPHTLIAAQAFIGANQGGCAPGVLLLPACACASVCCSRA